MSYIVPIGPYHPSLEEPIHARLITDGEQISDAEIFIGYKKNTPEGIDIRLNPPKKDGSGKVKMTFTDKDELIVLAESIDVV